MGKARLTWFHMTSEGAIHRSRCPLRPDLTASIFIDTKVIERLIRTSKLITIEEKCVCLAVPIVICRICLEEFLQKAITKEGTIASRVRARGGRGPV